VWRLARRLRIGKRREGGGICAYKGLHVFTDASPVVLARARARSLPAREKLVRFRIDGRRVVGLKVVDGLKSALTSGHAVLAGAAKVRDVKVGCGLNIEGLEISPDQQHIEKLDLGGHGIRGLSYVPALGAYLIIGGGPATG
jgi:hypothetical protein